jgi:hypothetical protein
LADGRSGFLDWLIIGRRGLPVTVIVTSHARSWADDLAARILGLAASGIDGLRHIPAARVVSRPELARHLLRLRGIEPRFAVGTRADQSVPHLGKVEIATIYTDDYAKALSAVV